MLKIVIQEFLPKLYDRYVEINVKYTEKHKKYETALPPFLKNRPRKIIDHLLDRMGKVESDEINSVEIVGENVFNVTSSDLSSTHRLKYRVDFGDKDRFCSCTCNDYRRNRMLCKHFFTVIDSLKSNFYNISKLFLEHPYINLDSALFERKTNETTIVSNTERKYGNHKEESSPKLLENDCPVEDVNTHMDFQLKSEPKQLFNKNIKHPYPNRVGERAKMMRQFYRAKIYIKEERSKSTTGTETCSIENYVSFLLNKFQFP